MASESQEYLREVQYRYPDRLQARSFLHTKYGRVDWFEWLAGNVPFSSSGTVVDVGCGAGAFWVNAPRTVSNDLKLRLFDLSEGMVKAAAAAVRNAGRWRDVEVAVADAVDLPLADASADTVLAIHMLYHLADPATGIREMARVSKTSGSLAVVLNPAGTMAELSSLIDGALDRDPEARREPLTSDQAIPLLRESYAHVTRIRFEDELKVLDPVDLLAYVLSLPVADDQDARERLARTTSAAFEGTLDGFRISKAADLLICRNAVD